MLEKAWAGVLWKKTVKGPESIQRGGPKVREDRRKGSDSSVSLQGTEAQGEMTGREWLPEVEGWKNNPH